MRNTGGTDHLSFDAVGIPGFQFIQDDLDYETPHAPLQPGCRGAAAAADLKQIATVEAIFVYNAAQRDQMMPRKPLPDPAGEEKRRAPLEGIFPGAIRACYGKTVDSVIGFLNKSSAAGRKPGGVAFGWRIIPSVAHILAEGTASKTPESE